MKTNINIQKLFCFIPPLAVMLVLCIIFKTEQIYPFGNYAISWGDMNQQVVPLLLNLKDILSGKGSIFYSLGNAGGMNFWGVFFFFLPSPFSFLVAFVDKENVSLFMSVLVILKLMTSSFTACIYFRSCHKTLAPGLNVILSVMYAFCGYGMLFYQNIIWLDMMYLFPLLLISFNKLIYKKKLAPYIIIMTAMIVVNYYISFMAIVFSIIFFGMYILIFRNEDREIVIWKFCMGSGAAVLLSGIVWLPSLMQYFSSGRGTDTVNGLIRSSFLTPIYTVFPLLFCTGIIFVVIIAAIIKERIKNRQILFFIILFAVMLLPVFIEPVNKMWHIGSYMGFPARYGFITVFMGLAAVAAVLAGKKYKYDTRSNHPLIFVALMAMVTGLAWFVYYYLKKNIKILDAYTSTLWGDAASFNGLLIIFTLMTAGYAVLYIFYDGKLLGRKPFIFLLSVILLAECWVNTNIYMVSAKNDVERYKTVIDLENKISDPDNFFRVKATEKLFDFNLIGGLGYNSLSHYTSLTSRNYLFTMKKLGYSSYWMEVGANGGTEFSDAILSNKYTISGSGKKETDLYANKNFSIRENEFYLPLGIVSVNDLTRYKELPDAGRMDIQEYIFKSLFATDRNLFIEYPYTQLINCSYEATARHILKKTDTSGSFINYNIYVKGRQTLYFDCFDQLSNNLTEPINKSFDVFVNDTVVQRNYPGQSNNGILSLGTYENENVTVRIMLLKNVNCKSYGVYGLDNEVLEDVVNNAKTVNMAADGRKITGTYNADWGEYAYISIPYDKGFTVKINGHKADYYKIYSDFIAIKLDKGKNEISLSYMPNGFYPGLGLTITGLLFIVLMIIIERKKLINTALLHKISYRLFLLGFCIVVALIYIIPVCINTLLKN